MSKDDEIEDLKSQVEELEDEVEQLKNTLFEIYELSRKGYR